VTVSGAGRDRDIMVAVAGKRMSRAGMLGGPARQSILPVAQAGLARFQDSSAYVRPDTFRAIALGKLATFG
jgi:hypothetical protein